MATTIPTTNAAVDKPTAHAASLRWTSLILAATSATRIATGASRPGVRTVAIPAIASENAHRKPAMTSALRGSGTALMQSSREPAGSARYSDGHSLQSGACLVGPRHDGASSRPSHRESAGGQLPPRPFHLQD